MQLFPFSYGPHAHSILEVLSVPSYRELLIVSFSTYNTVIHLVPNNLSGGKPFFMCADSQEDCEEWAREISVRLLDDVLHALLAYLPLVQAVSYELQETEFRKRESDLDDSGSRICSAHDTSESRDSTVEEDDEDSKLEWVDLNLNTDASVFLVGAETRVGSVIMSELLKEELVVRVLLT